MPPCIAPGAVQLGRVRELLCNYRDGSGVVMDKDINQPMRGVRNPVRREEHGCIRCVKRLWMTTAGRLSADVE
jgi:hypothetical protein